MKIVVNQSAFNNFILKNNFTFHLFCKEAGINPSYLSQLLVHNKTIGVKTRKKILQTINNLSKSNCSYSDFFEIKK